MLSYSERPLRSEIQHNLSGLLSVTYQQEIYQLNDDIRKFMQETYEVLHEEGNFEAEKNKLSNRMNNNLYERKELEATLQEMSMENRRRKLEKLRLTNKAICEVEAKIQLIPQFPFCYGPDDLRLAKEELNGWIPERSENLDCSHNSKDWKWSQSKKAFTTP
ncbi:hypothetical protein NPIL_677981 [Nephila pilipes]|uniref:Uncharacterized protein n=1 Tax=Nephila pilipes TaxID=299642 RepID=A0A8X6PIF1_NEPPI|nr:hypothetical protein NPIL_677981 [Nephila pilipes]